ncbi:hypothetical protein HYH03_007033 [Edaphochlamys debaryana]|uniref:Uncharacterized protein n=1 Tax=Edaphochlamys debaryana TaxID=47281 RepID=A0A835Y2K8_9CHLO|nr:hypothetical protein HYH03_007033 [Edaphochlamys debaryana]|eukprot:KAG2494790.1 hypothetical protein HYH03_007033 [Edaphochlamys debaryana]
MGAGSAAVASSFLVNLATAVAVFAVFSVIRVRSHKLRRFFAPRRYADDINLKPARLPKGLLGWVRPVLNYKEADVIDEIGLDGAMYLRILRFGINLFCGASLWCLVAVLPVNLSGGSVDELLGQQAAASSNITAGGNSTATGSDGASSNGYNDFTFTTFDKFSLTNVPSGSPRMWVHLLSVYFVALLTLGLLRKYNRESVLLRLMFLGNQPRGGPSHTVLVTDIPIGDEFTARLVKKASMAAEVLVAAVGASGSSSDGASRADGVGDTRDSQEAEAKSNAARGAATAGELAAPAALESSSEHPEIQHDQSRGGGTDPGEAGRKERRSQAGGELPQGIPPRARSSGGGSLPMDGPRSPRLSGTSARGLRASGTGSEGPQQPQRAGALPPLTGHSLDRAAGARLASSVLPPLAEQPLTAPAKEPSRRLNRLPSLWANAVVPSPATPLAAGPPQRRATSLHGGEARAPPVSLAGTAPGAVLGEDRASPAGVPVTRALSHHGGTAAATGGSGVGRGASGARTEDGGGGPGSAFSTAAAQRGLGSREPSKSDSGAVRTAPSLGRKVSFGSKPPPSRALSTASTALPDDVALAVQPSMRRQTTTSGLEPTPEAEAGPSVADPGGLPETPPPSSPPEQSQDKARQQVEASPINGTAAGGAAVAASTPGQAASPADGKRQRPAKRFDYDLQELMDLDPTQEARTKLQGGMSAEEFVWSEFVDVYGRSAVAAVNMVLDTRQLEGLVAEYDKLSQALEDHLDMLRHRLRLRKETEHAKILVLGARYGAWGREHLGTKGFRRVDAVDFWLARLKHLRGKIMDAQEEAAGRYAPSAFVIFNTRMAQAVSAAALHANDVKTWRVQGAPAPFEVVWRNLGLTLHARSGRRILLWVAFGAMTLFFMIPVSAIQALIEVPKLATVPVLGDIVTAPVIQQILEAIVPGLALRLFLMVVPLILRVMAVESGSTSLSQVDFRVVRRFFVFQVIVVFMGTIIAGAFFNQLRQWIEDPASVVPVLGKSIPMTATFFITYLFISGMGTNSIAFLRPIDLGLFWLLSRFAGSPRAARRLWSEQHTDCGTTVVDHTMAILLGLVFSCINPIVCPAALSYFLVTFLAESYNNLYVFRRQYESAGQLWKTVYNQVMVGLYIMQLTMLGLLALKRFPFAALVLPLLLLTVAAHLRTLSLYQRPWSVTSLHDATALDKWEAALVTAQRHRAKASGGGTPPAEITASASARASGTSPARSASSSPAKAHKPHAMRKLRLSYEEQATIADNYRNPAFKANLDGLEALEALAADLRPRVDILNAWLRSRRGGCCGGGGGSGDGSRGARRSAEELAGRRGSREMVAGPGEAAAGGAAAAGPEGRGESAGGSRGAARQRRREDVEALHDRAGDADGGAGSRAEAEGGRGTRRRGEAAAGGFLDEVPEEVRKYDTDPSDKGDSDAD